MHARYQREGADSNALFHATSRPHPLNSALTNPMLFRGGFKA